MYTTKHTFEQYQNYNYHMKQTRLLNNIATTELDHSKVNITDHL